MRVAILAIDGMRGFDLSIAIEVFGSGAVDGAPANEVSVVGPADPVTLTGGMAAPTRPLATASDADLVVVPGFADLDASLAGFDDADGVAAVAALVDAHSRGAQLVSLCTGAFLLARTGLLDGARATTHWRHAARLQSLHPEIRVDATAIYLHDPARRLWTSAGVTAGVDTCLAIVRHVHGAAAAAAVARSMVIPVARSGGQAQFVPPRARPTDLPDAGFDRLRELVGSDLSAPWPLSRLAAAAHVSPRTLQRHFAALGLRPSGWLVGQRVVAAQELLESSRLSVEQVAGRVGFGSADLLRKHFVRLVSVSPTAYRAAFQRSDPVDVPEPSGRHGAG